MSAPATKSFQRALTTAGEFARLETFLRRELYGLLQYKESHEGDEGGCDKKWVVEPSQEFWKGNGTKVQSVSVSDLSKVDGTAKGDHLLARGSWICSGHASEIQGHEDILSPEDLFVASANICLMTTFLAVAERVASPSHPMKAARKESWSWWRENFNSPPLRSGLPSP